MALRILYAFSADWNHEFAAYARGEVPSHRLFGFIELQKLGLQPLTCPSPPALKRKLSGGMAWRVYQAMFAFFRQWSVDCIFAVNEASALPMLMLKRLGILRTPIIIFCTGLMHPRNCSGKRGKLWRWLLPCAEAVVSQTSMEFESTPKEFALDPKRQVLIHMLVDVDYFKPDYSPESRGDFCLAVGTNQGRDYPTLLKAFPRDQKLIIITDAYNAAIVEKHREPDMKLEVLQAVPIDKLRDYYRRARVIINPLAEIPYCSGHTVLLENMALGRLIIVSGVGGMRDYLVDGVNSLVVRPGDVEQLRQVIAEVLENPAKFEHIGPQAVESVRRFSTTNFAVKLNDAIKQVLAGRKGASAGIGQSAAPATPQAAALPQHQG
jgi:glycosyltransferase involved in cell wall biosynthesis